MVQYSQLLIATIIVLIPCTISYPNGAPDNSCFNLMPGHNVPPQQTRSPYVILVNQTRYRPNEIIRVMIRGLCGRMFKGFLIEARRADPRMNTTELLGVFSQVAGTQWRCMNKGLTHTGNAPTGSLIFEWMAPSMSSGHVIIKGTFVENYTTYWASVNSAIIYDPNSMPLSVTPSSLLTPYITPCESDRAGTAVDTTTTTSTTTSTTTTTTTTTNPPTTTRTTTPVPTTKPPTTTTATTLAPSTRRTLIPTVAPSLTTTAPKTTITTEPGTQAPIWETTAFIPFHDPDHGWINHPDGKNVPTVPNVLNTPNEPNTNFNSGFANDAPQTPIKHILMKEECGATHGCFSKCDTKNCEFLVTWKEYGDKVNFEVFATALEGTEDQYVAVAFSRDTKMGHDSVVECLHINGRFTAHLSYNERFVNQRLEDNPEVLELRSAIFHNGIFSCHFSRSKKSIDVNRIFNLDKDYFVIFGQGPIADRLTGTIGKHLTDPYATAQIIDFQKHENVEIYKLDKVFIKIHGCFMAFAWMFCASIGIVISRFYKPLWPTTMVCGRKVWYTVHRFLMCLVGILVLAAFIIIFLEVQGLSEISLESMKKLHPVVGIIVTFLTVVNILMGMFRPGYDSKHRTAFNWVHWCTGIMDHIIAIVNIVLGVELQKAHVHSYIQYIIFCYAAYQFLIVVILEIVQCNSRVKERKQQTYMIYERRSTFYSSSRESGEDDTEPPGSFIRKVILKLHVLLITAFSAAVVFIIAMD